MGNLKEPTYEKKMVTEFDTGLPSARQVQIMIRDRQSVEIKLVTGDTLTGQLQWQDHHALCVGGNGQNTLLMRGAIAYIKAVS